MKDKRLLYWLDRDARMTKKRLGEKIHLSQQGVSYRINRLQERGVIENFVTFINTLVLGYTHYKVFLKLHDVSPENETKIVEELVSHDHVRWVVDTGGVYDVSFSILATSHEEFRQIYHDLASAFGGYVGEKNVVVNVESPGYTRSYFLDDDTSERRPYSGRERTVEVDETDQAILKCMSLAARKNIVDIAEDVDETVDVVQYRLEKLREEGVISGHTIQIDRNELGLEYYSVFFHMHNVTDDVEHAVNEFARTHPHVLFVVYAIGSHDVQLEIEVESYKQLQSILREFRNAFNQHISSFDTLRVLNEYKYNFYPFNLQDL